MIKINEEIIELMKLFEGSFINQDLELILVPKENIYFRLEDVKSLIDLKCKVIAFLSRPSCKDHSLKVRKYCTERFNEFLKTSFSEDEIMEIYTYLGNDCNRSKCVNFIKSEYDFSILY